jgi:hypothetical protein
MSQRVGCKNNGVINKKMLRRLLAEFDVKNYMELQEWKDHDTEKSEIGFLL